MNMQSSKLVDEFTRAVRRRQSLRDWAKALLGAALIFLLVYLWSLIYGSPAAGAAERPQRQTFSGIGTVDRFADGHAQVKFQGLTAQVYPAFAISPSTGTPAFSPRYSPAADEVHFVSDIQSDGGKVLKKLISLGRRTITSLLPNDATSVPQILSSARFTLSGIDPSNGIAAQAVGESTFSVFNVTESFFCWAIQVNDAMKLERPTAGWDVPELKQHGFYWYNGAGSFYVCFPWDSYIQNCTWFDPAFTSQVQIYNSIAAKTLLINASLSILDTISYQPSPGTNYNNFTFTEVKGLSGVNVRGWVQLPGIQSATLGYSALFWRVSNASMEWLAASITGTQTIILYKGTTKFNTTVLTYTNMPALGTYQFSQTPTSGTNTFSASAFTVLMDDYFRDAWHWSYGFTMVSSNEGGGVDADVPYYSADTSVVGRRPNLRIQLVPRNPATSIVRAGLRTATQAIINVTGVDSQFQYRLNRGSVSVLSASLTATAKADGSSDILINIPADYDYMVQVGRDSVWCTPITLHQAGGATDISSLPTLAQLNTEIASVTTDTRNVQGGWIASVSSNITNASAYLDALIKFNGNILGSTDFASWSIDGEGNFNEGARLTLRGMSDTSAEPNIHIAITKSNGTQDVLYGTYKVPVLSASNSITHFVYAFANVGGVTSYEHAYNYYLAPKSATGHFVLNAQVDHLPWRKNIRGSWNVKENDVDTSALATSDALSDYGDRLWPANAMRDATVAFSAVAWNGREAGIYNVITSRNVPEGGVYGVEVKSVTGALERHVADYDEETNRIRRWYPVPAAQSLLQFAATAGEIGVASLTVASQY